MIRALLGCLLLGGTVMTASASEALRHQVVTFDGELPVLRDGSRIDSTLYEENFSSGLGGWSGLDLTNMASTWHPDSWNDVDGTQAWWSADANVGGYVDHSLLFLELPALNLNGTSQPMLRCDLFYAMEATAGAPAPYDGWDACHVEVRMGAGPWQILPPVTPAYNVSQAFSFGEIFGQAPTAGWGGQSGGWLEAEFDLSAYQSAATRIRFAVCSDDGTSYPDDPTLTGMQVDNIEISDGDNVLLRNDADGVDFPGPTLHYSGVPSAGNNWASTPDNHSGPAAVRCSVLDQDVPINNALVSPPILLPSNYTLLLDFWTRVDLHDFDGDGDTSLEDYFLLEYSLDGSTWNELFYDYYDTETGSGNWYHFVNGGGHNRSTDVSFLGGDLVFFRFRVTTDDNHDGGTGEGLFIDDFRVMGEPLLAQDAGLVEFRLPYPRTVGRPIDCNVLVQNFGSEPIEDVEWGIWMDGFDQGIGGLLSLAVGARENLSFSLTPSEPSFHFPEARLESTDQFLDNNVLTVPSFVVRGNDVLELANDYSWDVTNTDFLHTTGYAENLGVGYTQRFALPAMGENMGFSLDSLRLRLASYNIPPDESADWQLDVRMDHPVTGTLLAEGSYSYTPTYAGGEASEDWIAIDLSSQVADLLTEGTLWVTIYSTSEGSYQAPGDPVPNVTLVPRSWEDAASARIVQGAVIGLAHHQFNYHVFGHEELIDSVNEPVVQADRTRLGAAWPNPFNPSTTVAFHLQRPGETRLALYDVLGRQLRVLDLGTLPAGEHTQMLLANDLASGLYLLELQVDGSGMDRSKLMLLK